MAVRPYKDGWRLDYRDAEGNRYRRTYVRKKDAEAAAAKITTQIGEGSFIAPKKIPTFREVAERWFATKRNYRPATLDGWRTHLDNHLLPDLGELRVTAIDAETMERFSQGRLDRGKLCAKTINGVLVTAGAVFKYAMKHKLCVTNPAKLADRVRENTGEVGEGANEAERTDDVVREDEVLTKEELVRLLQHATPGLYRTLFETAAFTGCRHNELLALRWTDCDLELGTVTIRRSLTWPKLPGEGSRPRFYDPKTKAGRRTLPLPAGLVHQLKRWKLQCPKGELGLVFPTADGLPLRRSVVLRYGLRPACRRAGLRQISVLTLRHTFASTLLSDGAALAEVQKLMGHAHATTTLRTYTHFIPRSETDAVSKFAAAVFALWTPNGHSTPTAEGMDG
jgi:integrase